MLCSTHADGGAYCAHEPTALTSSAPKRLSHCCRLSLSVARSRWLSLCVAERRPKMDESDCQQHARVCPGLHVVTSDRVLWTHSA